MKRAMSGMLALALMLLPLAALAEGAAEQTLEEGRFIIGEDIAPGVYALTCVGTAGEQLGDAYGALGSALDALDGSGSGEYGSLFGSLGGLMAEYVGATVEILGDYGDVLETYEMQTGDVLEIELEAGTALKISDGSCTLAAVEE